MRRLIAVFMVLVMSVAFAGVACAEEKVELSFTLWGTNEGLTSVFELGDQYNESQDKIHVTVSGVEASVYFQKLNAFFSSNTAPDIIQVAADYGNEYTAKGVFAPLDDFMTDDLSGVWAESLLDALRTDGVLYGIPIGVQNSFIAYNKTLFDEAGIAYPTNDWTETEMIDLAKQLTDAESGQYGLLIAGNVKELVRDLYGDYVYDWDSNTMTAEGNESFKHGLQMFYDMFVTDKVTPAVMSTTDIGGGFETGKYPMAFIHYWDIASLSTTIGDTFDWDIVQFPISEEFGTRWKSPLYVQALSISEQSAHKEEAFEFIKWWATQTAPQTSMADSFPVAIEVYSSEEYLNTYNENHPYDKQVVINTVEEQGIAWWNCGTIAEINRNVIEPAVEELLLQIKEVSVDETIAIIQEKGQQAFDMNDF